MAILHNWLAAETHLAGGEFLKAAVNREEFLKKRGRTRIPVMSKMDCQHFYLNKRNLKRVHQDEVFYCAVHEGLEM